MNRCERKAPIFRLALTLALVLAVGMLCLAPPAAADLFSPNLELAVGPGFQLVGTPGDPIAPVNPLVWVGLNPQPLPPGPGDFESLNLSNPFAPSIANTGAGSLFSVFWYVQSPTPFQPQDPVFPYFRWTDSLQNVFVATFTISGAPLSFVALNPQPLPPGGFQGFMATFDPPAGATLSFSVTENGVPLSFQLQPVPAPGTLLLLGSGLVGLFGYRRRWRRERG